MWILHLTFEAAEYASQTDWQAIYNNNLPIEVPFTVLLLHFWDAIFDLMLGSNG